MPSCFQRRLVYVRAVEVVGGGSGAAPLEPPSGHTELPSCPVCLERLDEHISGVVVTVSGFSGGFLGGWVCVGTAPCVCTYWRQLSPCVNG